VDAGNSIIVIEHNPDVMKNADYIIDLGPGAGDAGGYVVAAGTPKKSRQCPHRLPVNISSRFLPANMLVSGQPNTTLSVVEGHGP